MDRWLPADVRKHWETELAEFQASATRIGGIAQHCLALADEIESYAPELAQEYREHAKWEQARAQRCRNRSQQIRDYLAGRISEWW